MAGENRRVTVYTPLPGDELVFHRMVGHEELSRLFEFEVELYRPYEYGQVKADTLLGQNLSIELDTVPGGYRYFSGLISRLRHTGGVINRYISYRATVRPWLWLLTLTTDCKIFQDKSVVDIIKAVFAEYSFATDVKYELMKSYPTLDYCVQYRESDFNFISRLMEHYGIYYYFIHDLNKHTLVITDNNAAFLSTGGYDSIPYFPPENELRRERDHIWDWVSENQICSAQFELTDFDFEAPSADLTTKSQNTGKYTHDNLEVYDYPGKYTKTGDGNPLVDARMEASQTGYAVVKGEGNAMGIQPGLEFSLTDFYVSEQNGQHYIVSAHYIIENDDIVSSSDGKTQLFQCEFSAVPSKQQFTPARLTQKPIIAGNQTAIVVGKSGEEIWTDKYGRVKVQFHWDRDGKKDEKTTCWIRVSHPMAGKNWGWISLPRIGQEVIVSFLEGDPDQPIITGRVYNAEQMPPYSLPANQTQSGIKTRSSKSGTADNFNEIRFEDKKGEEELYIHAEKDCNRVVENDDTLKVGFDKKDPGDQTIDIYNHRTVTLDQGNDTLHIKKGNLTTTVDTGNETRTIKTGNLTTSINTGNETHTIKKGNLTTSIDMGNETRTLKMGNRTTKLNLGKDAVEAMQAIELKVGANSIKIDQMGITIKGIMIKIEGTAMVEMKGPMTTVKGDGLLILKGGVTMIN
jgi:type VI secretion system secreted protein VgrG